MEVLKKMRASLEAFKWGIDKSYDEVEVSRIAITFHDEIPQLLIYIGEVEEEMRELKEEIETLTENAKDWKLR